MRGSGHRAQLRQAPGLRRAERAEHGLVGLLVAAGEPAGNPMEGRAFAHHASARARGEEAHGQVRVAGGQGGPLRVLELLQDAGCLRQDLGGQPLVLRDDFVLSVCQHSCVPAYLYVYVALCQRMSAPFS